MNDWITIFMEVMNLLSSCFLDIRYREGSKAEADSFRKIKEALLRFDQRSGKCGYLLIRSRGLDENPMAMGSDGYEIVTRDISVNTMATPTLIKEAGSRLSFFSGRLVQAFDVFSSNNITSIYLKLPWRLPDDLDQLKDGLRILSGFIWAAKTDSPVVFKRNGKQISIPLVKDEKGRPHPNLTLAMGLNNLDPVKMQAMVTAIDAMVSGADSDKTRGQFIDVYDAMKCSPKFRQLMKPPIEINNVRWLIADREPEEIPNSKIHVTRAAVDFSIEAPHKVAQLLTSIYGDDFDRISARVLGERLILITAFLNTMGNGAADTPLEKEVFDSILSRFTQVRRETRNDLTLINSKLHVKSSGIEIPMGMIHPEFVKMIRFFSGSPQPKDPLPDVPKDVAAEPDDRNSRSAKPPVEAPMAHAAPVPAVSSEKKASEKIDQHIHKTEASKMDKSSEKTDTMEEMVGARIDQMELGALMRPEEQAGQTGKQSNLSDAKKAAVDLVTPFKQCFDTNGHFVKGSFEKTIPEFTRHRDQIFEFIWQYLKGTMNRVDRLALLNSLYMLVNKIDQSEKAVSVLLNDIFKEPTKVDISDRNALMLASLVIRKYNKEFNQEIELTPEEVFLVKEGLIGSTVKVASEIIENNPKNVMQKHMTVYAGIAQSLKLNEAGEAATRFRYLLNLEREACIFLSLVGGPTPRAVICDAVKSYGDPESEIYRLNGDAGHTTAFLQHLKVLVRGLGRIGKQEDIPVLEDLMHKEEGFMRFDHDSRSQDMVQRIMKWAGDAVEHIALTQETVTA